MIDDLRPCIAHRLPINQSEVCWLAILMHLGQRCVTDAIRERQWLPRASFSRPTIREQAVFANQIGLLKTNRAPSE